MELDTTKTTEIGSYFVSNYPPFSAWSTDQVPQVLQRLEQGPVCPPHLGLYLHIPFCRKRCKFCYFRVYTDKNAREIEKYVEALANEAAMYAARPGLGDRPFDFVYFGGGTPSYLSAAQLTSLVERINKYRRWDLAKEVTFECEPGTLNKGKLEAIKQIGTTRLSLGVEHFDDTVLEVNGRAHKSPEVFRAYEWARDVGFPDINIDLIAGMVGDTDDKWNATVDHALAMQPDCLTVYQMEMPHNAVFSREARESGGPLPVADWPTKRRWVDHAFDVFERAGYVVSSAYTLVKPGRHQQFLYRDALWHGADMIGLGVASFSHFNGIHFQNHDGWDDYIGHVSAGSLPIARGLAMTRQQKLTRELILQLKLGTVERQYFREKFGTDIADAFAHGWEELARRNLVLISDDGYTLTRDALLQVDALLPVFFEPSYRA